MNSCMSMPAASLCELCRDIPFHDLPPFPDAFYTRGVSGYEHLHRLVRIDKDDSVPWPLGFHHQPDLASLRREAAAGCELCRQIEIQADDVLADATDWKAKWEGFPEVRALPADPDFDLWITGRGEGGHGFWVSAASESRRDGLLFCLATFGFCVTDDSQLASTFLGRPIIGTPDASVLDRAIDWISTCDSHENCNSDKPPLPTRLIDLGASDHVDVVTVVEPERGTRGTFTALSYSWGAMPNLYTSNRSLLDARKDPMEISDLPRTFRDAIAFTRRLGVRYIWIDTLCIYQDDAKDWERESARMAAVYSNAYLVIAASGSTDPSGGLLFDRPEKPYMRIEFEQANTGAAGTGVLVFPLEKAKEFLRNRRIMMADQPLAKRGWAFQERVLARRVLHFASDQISFECLEGTILEEGLRIPYRYFHTHPLTRHEKEATKPRRRFGGQHRPKQSNELPVHRWFSLLRMYSERKLSFPNDIFPAISSVAKVYGELMDDEYVAGIWLKTMIEGLCWQSLRCKPVDRYRAPSWSWASVDGMVHAGFHSIYREIGTVLDYHVHVEGDNPFGRVKEGWLKILAPLVRLELSETSMGPTGFMKLKVAGSDKDGSINGFDTLDRNYSASADVVRGMELYALVLAAIYEEETEPDINWDAKDEDCVYNCLLVTPIEQERAGQGSSLGTFKRVGWNLFEPNDFGAGELSSPMATVTLV